MRIEIVLARPRAFESWTVNVPMGATIADALAAADLTPAWCAGQGIDGLAIHGVRAEADATLRDGDRIELLRPLVADPKDARRRRAAGGDKR
jgi:putative ubiquitin-RnfH superfamily antitoxin RatB of RatAB toxin-antitoxin module